MGKEERHKWRKVEEMVKISLPSPYSLIFPLVLIKNTEWIKRIDMYLINKSSF